MKIKHLRTLGLKVFKTLNILNPAFTEERTKLLTHRPNDIQVNAHKTAKYGDKSLRILGSHIWNLLPEHIKPVVWTNLQM